MKKGQLIKKNILKDILRENGGWMKSSEIETIIGSTLNIKIFKGTLKRFYHQSKDVVIYNSKTDEYKLLKLLSKEEILKTENIENIIFHFLNSHDNPKNIGEIVDYVRLYKPNSSKISIQTSIWKTKKKKFVLFKGNLIGIVSKKYSDSFIIKQPKYILNEIYTNHKTIFTLICEFLNEENEPKSSKEIRKALRSSYAGLKNSSVFQTISLKKHKLNRFYPNNFGLISKKYSSEWIQIPKNRKEATINEYIIEYLVNEKLPKHLSEITANILKNKPGINSTSVKFILRNQNNSHFIIFKNNYYGLISKIYPKEFQLHKIINRISITKILLKYLENEITPKSITEIYDYLKKDFQYNGLQNLKQNFITNKHLFIKFENNFFGLMSKEYSSEYVEKKKDLIKISIPDLIQGYLDKEKNPIHIDVIVDYVHQFKPNSNKRSIFYNIKYAAYDKFKLLNRNYIGIANREYSNEYVRTKIPKKFPFQIKDVINDF